MSDFQCKFYLLDGAETLECKDGNAEYVAKIADRPFPDSLLSFVYYDDETGRQAMGCYAPASI